MSPRFRCAVIGVFLAGALALSGIDAGGRPAPAVRLFDLTTARDIVEDKASRPTRVFAPDDEVIYLWYAAEGCAVGTTIRATWLYLETDPPFPIADGEVRVTRNDTWGQFNFRLAQGRRWAIGRYRIQLSVGNEVMAEIDFWVSSVQTAVQAAGIPAAVIAQEGRMCTWLEGQATQWSGR